MSQDKIDFVSKENEARFVISEEDLEDACMDVDLQTVAPEFISAMENEKLTTQRLADTRDADSYSDYNADVEDDDDISYGLAIDDEIVNDVLGGSEQRKKDQVNEKVKKICKYSIIACWFIAVLYYIVLVRPDSMVMHDIEDHGSAFHYDDEESFLEKPRENVFDIPLEISDVVSIPQVYNNCVDVRGPAFSDGETPFFVQHNDGSSIVEIVLSKCHGLIIAGATQSVPSSLQDSLTTFTIENDPIQTYVTVDLSGEGGIMNAREKNLIPKSAEIGLDAVFTPSFYFAGENLFSPEHKARLFTMIRNPVDRTIAEYYTFIQSASEDALREMSLEEFIESEHYQTNWFTAFVAGKFDEPLTDPYLQSAKELLRTKYIIGVHDNIYGSIELFEDYFFWRSEGSRILKKCRRKNMKGEFNRNFAIYHKVGHRIRQNSTLYQIIVGKNQLDMELYWHGVELHRAQRSWIPKQYPTKIIPLKI